MFSLELRSAIFKRIVVISNHSQDPNYFELIRNCLIDYADSFFYPVLIKNNLIFGYDSVDQFIDTILICDNGDLQHLYGNFLKLVFSELYGKSYEDLQNILKDKFPDLFPKE